MFPTSKIDFNRYLIHTFPLLYKNNYFHSCDIGSGWYSIIVNLSKQLDNYVKALNMKDFFIGQIKDKFGGLRIAVSHGDNEIYEMIEAAEKEANKTCCNCGSQSKVKNRFMNITLCSACFKKQQR